MTVSWPAEHKCMTLFYETTYRRIERADTAPSDWNYLITMHEDVNQINTEIKEAEANVKDDIIKPQNNTLRTKIIKKIEQMAEYLCMQKNLNLEEHMRLMCNKILDNRQDIKNQIKKGTNKNNKKYVEGLKIDKIFEKLEELIKLRYSRSEFAFRGSSPSLLMEFTVWAGIILGLLLLIMIVMAIVNALPFLMIAITPPGLSASVIYVMQLLSTVATSTTNLVILWGLIGTTVLTELSGIGSE